MRRTPTLREQLQRAQSEAWYYRQALQAVLAEEVTWTEWQETKSHFSEYPYYAREGSSGNLVIHHTRYTSHWQAGGAASRDPGANGYWENVDVREVRE
jgi:hypothetical protein